MKFMKRGQEVNYAGRSVSASTATGYGKMHEVESTLR